MSMQECVLVVRRDLLTKDKEIENGIITEDVLGIYELARNNFSFMVRSEAEVAHDYKQIIPYVIVTYDDKYLLFRRKQKQTEARLHDKFSLGVGGHINPLEQADSDVILAGLYREFHEELSLEGYSVPKFIGIINDDSNDVGKVHLGFLFLVSATSNKYSLPESDKMTAEWVSKEDLVLYYDKMETWTQLFCDYFIFDGEEGTK